MKENDKQKITVKHSKNRQIAGPILTAILVIGVSLAIYVSYQENQDRKTQQASLSKAPEAKLHIIQPPSVRSPRHQIVGTMPSVNPQEAIEEEIPQIEELVFQSTLLDDDTELHAIGIYEGTTPPGVDDSPWWSRCGDMTRIECHGKLAGSRVEKEVNVTVSYNESPVALLLMSYDPVLWKLNVAHGVEIERIILTGYHPQRISGQGSGIPIDVYTHKPSECERCNHGDDAFYAYETGSKDKNTINRIRHKILKATGKLPVSFQARYTGKEFYLTNNVRRLVQK